MAQIGLVGLGLVGGALAERFLLAGHTVSGFDLEAPRRAELTQRGGNACASARDVAAAAELCVLSLPTSDIAATVLNEIDSLLAGKIVIDTTTGEPEMMARLSESLATKKVTYLDATIVGSSKHVQSGDVLLLVGGSEVAFRACGWVFECFARQTFYLGPSGSGARMKLVVNLVLGLHRAVLAEGLTFAQAYGVDPAQALDVLKTGLAYSRVMDTKGAKMLARDFQVEARLSQHHKDVGLILNAARNMKLDLPLSQVHDQLLAAAESAGYGDADNSAIIAAYERPRE